MKKKLSLTLVVVLLLATALCACDTGTEGEGTGDGAAGKVNLSMATGGTSGTYYGFSGVVAQVLNEHLSDVMTVTVESTGASKANIQLVNVGESDMGIVQNDVMYYAYTGTDMFDGATPATDFSAVMAVYAEPIQIVTTKDITSIEQLKGKKVSVGDAGSGVEFNARQILEAYGMTFDDIQVNNQSFADSADSMKNGTIDAVFLVAGTPTTAISELASSYDFNILSIDDEHAAALQSKYGFYTTATIPGGTYSPVEQDVQTVSVMATYIARNDVPEEAVYNFVKGMFEYKDSITAGHSNGKMIDINTAVSGISIPFHPGAEKYFKEQGVL